MAFSLPLLGFFGVDSSEASSTRGFDRDWPRFLYPWGRGWPASNDAVCCDGPAIVSPGVAAKGSVFLLSYECLIDLGRLMR